VLVFFYAPGIYRDGRLDESAMAEFTGIRLRMTTAPTELRVKLKAGHALTDGLRETAFGVPHKTSPACWADDPAATVLATLPDGRPGLVIKPRSGWTAIFSAVPMLPASLLRRIARLGGVHQYIETEDVVWASREMVAVCVKEPGPRKIALPRPAFVRDLYSSQEIAKSANSFEASFGRRSTRLFELRAAPTDTPSRDRDPSRRH
jgi:hypothetical protein